MTLSDQITMTESECLWHAADWTSRGDTAHVSLSGVNKTHIINDMHCEMYTFLFSFFILHAVLRQRRMMVMKTSESSLDLV